MNISLAGSWNGVSIAPLATSLVPGCAPGFGGQASGRLASGDRRIAGQRCCVAPGNCGEIERGGSDDGAGWAVDCDSGHAGDRGGGYLTGTRLFPIS
jgi:hypothetical protein